MEDVNFSSDVRWDTPVGELGLRCTSWDAEELSMEKAGVIVA